jgi:putative hydrolase of the HAD superfamily
METFIDKEVIKVLLIDIGGVLLTNGWPKEGREAAARQFEFDFSEMESRHNLVYPIYEEGHISLDAYLDLVLFDRERSFSRQTFKEFMFQQSKPLASMLDWLIEWKKGHLHLQFFSLNNEPKDLHHFRVEKFGLRRLFDGFVVSCDIGMRKPNPGIYALAVAVAGVRPDECLYIDDREVLVAAGRKTGVQGWVHRGQEETRKLLDGL